MKRLILMIILQGLIAASLLYAATVQVSWDANTEPDIYSYRVYEGTTLIGEVLHPATSIDIPNVPDGTWIYFITALDQSRNESLRSLGAGITIDTTAPAKPKGVKAIIKN